MGGTFNPIHLAHLYIAYEAKEQLNLDKVIFMPAGNPPHKKDTIIDAKFRYEMVRRAIEGYEGFEINSYEIEKNGYSYTYETLNVLKEVNLKLYFIAGADSLMDIEKWKNTKEVLNNCTFVVFNRGEFNRETLKSQKEYLENKYQAEIVLLDIMSIDISSTIIRKRIKLPKSRRKKPAPMKTAGWASVPMPAAALTASITTTNKEFCHALY